MGKKSAEYAQSQVQHDPGNPGTPAVKPMTSSYYAHRHHKTSFRELCILIA